jgi:hypothetical protein
VEGQDGGRGAGRTGAGGAGGRRGGSAVGRNLHIPYAFSTVETMVPRAIAQRPRMLYLPREQKWEENAENVRELIDWQQDQIDVELTWQDIMRSGFIYGLGVGKAFWRKEYAPQREVRRGCFGIRARPVALLRLAS